MAIGTAAAPEDDTAGLVPVSIPKTEAEISRIRSAVRANFLFQHLNEAQARCIFDAMVRTDVAAGEAVIQQGSPGDHFYIADSGEYAVTVTPANSSSPVEVMKYVTSTGTNPCFGELAILHNKPRAATVTCVSAGALWAIDRRSFRAVLVKSSSRQLRRTLRLVDILKSLSLDQLQRLEDVLTEVTYADGDIVVRQGELTDTFYVIVSGCVEVSREDEGGGQVSICEHGAPLTVTAHTSSLTLCSPHHQAAEASHYS
jgi:CRP-like cAMP-binding protein